MISQSNEDEQSEEDKQDDQSQPLIRRGSIRKAGVINKDVAGEQLQAQEAEDFEDEIRKRYDFIKQSMDYQMNEIVKEIDRRRSIGGPKQSPNKLFPKSPQDNQNITSEGRGKMNKKETMIIMTKQILNNSQKSSETSLIEEQTVTQMNKLTPNTPSFCPDEDLFKVNHHSPMKQSEKSMINRIEALKFEENEDRAR